MSIAADLLKRGLVQQLSSVGMWALLEHRPTRFYLGFDPTADALHIGHLLPLTTSLRLMLAGHPMLALVGGATADVGDPTGHTLERPRMLRETLSSNVQCISAALDSFLSRGRSFGESFPCLASTHGPAAKHTILNNDEWQRGILLVDFLRNVGRHTRVSRMMHRDSVRARLESTAGLSFAELSYQLLQAYDFFHLMKNYDCRIQIGGTDQWGNILAGQDYIQSSRTESDPKVYGMTTPLLTSSHGGKMGKSDKSGVIWLDASKTSPFDFYQHFRRTTDQNVKQLLSFLTFLPVPEIETILDLHASNPQQNQAQKILATHLTSLVHGEHNAHQSEKQANYFHILRDGGSKVTDFEDLKRVLCGTRFLRTANIDFGHGKKSVSDLLIAAGICTTHSQAGKLGASGCLKVNGQHVSSPETHELTESDLQGGRLLYFRMNQFDFCAVHVVPLA